MPPFLSAPSSFPALIVVALCFFVAVIFGFLALGRVRAVTTAPAAGLIAIFGLLFLGYAALRNPTDDGAVLFWARWMFGCLLLSVCLFLFLIRQATGAPSWRILASAWSLGGVFFLLVTSDLVLVPPVEPFGVLGVPRYPQHTLLYWMLFVYAGSVALLGLRVWVRQARKEGGRMPGGVGRLSPILAAGCVPASLLLIDVFNFFGLISFSVPVEWISLGVVLVGMVAFLEEFVGTHHNLEGELDHVRRLNEEIEERRRHEAALAAENQELLKEELVTLRHELDEIHGSTRIVGRSEAMEKLVGLIRRLAPLDVTVLIVGETGTGKELVARELHALSPRSGKPFVAVNVAAIPEALQEAELFGHAAGAFTGARRARPGIFERASGGTLFLDEIGEASPALQMKLLRVLQERVVTRVGAAEDIPVDVRVVAATHQDLDRLQKEGRFREDLYYRLNVVSLPIPALRERAEDIPILAAHFLEKYRTQKTGGAKGFSRKVIEALSAYAWPGNIRELQNVVERAVVLSQSEQISSGDLPAAVMEALSPREGDGTDPAASTAPPWLQLLGPDPALARLERAYVIHVLEACEGNKTRAAERLGVNLRTLHRWLRGYEETGTG